MSDTVLGYLIGTGITLIIGWVIWVDAYSTERQVAARIALFCWAWPVLLGIGLYLGIRALWRDANMPTLNITLPNLNPWRDK
jgi:hypothetical protein